MPAFSTERSEQPAQKVPPELIDLARAIARLPGEIPTDLRDAYDRVVAASQRRQRTLREIRESLSELRLDLKYLMFDLEVTRRERDELQARLADEF